MTQENPSEKLNRRGAVGLAATLAMGAAAVSVPLHAGEEKAPKRTGVYPEEVGTDSPTYSPAILAEGNRLLFISGQGPKDLNADPETQIRQTFENIEAVLKAAGASWGNVVIIRSFFMNMKRDLPLFRKVRKEFLVEPYPASTAVGTTELAIPGLEIEFEAVAIL
jgi:enamine deaminase RidA (YjgF/YER057c/UK114 family)